MTDPVHYLPIATTLLCAGFATVLLRHHRREGEGTHLLWWAGGVVAYGVSTFAEAYTTLVGWTEWGFRAWHVAGALLAGFLLAQGMAYLLLRRRMAHVLAATVVPLVLVASVSVALTPIDPSLVEEHRLSAEVVTSPWVTLLGPIVHLYVLVFFVGGAGLVAVRGTRAGGMRRRAWGHGLMAAGGLLLVIVGSLAPVGDTKARYVTQLLGLLLVLGGYGAITSEVGALRRPTGEGTQRRQPIARAPPAPTPGTGWLSVPARHPLPTLAVLVLVTLFAADAARDVRPEVDFTTTVPPGPQLDAYREMLAGIDGIRFTAIYMAHDPTSGTGSLRTDEGFDALVEEQRRLIDHLAANLPQGTISHTLSVYDAMRAGNYMFAKIATAGNPPPSSYSVPTDPVTYEAVRDQVREGGSADEVLAKDGSSAIVLVFYTTRDPIAARAEAAHVGDLVGGWAARTSQHPVTMEHAASGLLNAAHYVDEINARETRAWSQLAAVVVLVGLALALRGPINALIAVTTLAVALVWTYGLMGVLELRISFLTLFLAPVVIGIGVDHAVHLLQRYEEERRRAGHRNALAVALHRTTAPIVVAGLTTVTSLAALRLVPAPLFAELGLLAALGIVFAVLASLTLAPALRALVPSRMPRASTHRDLIGAPLARMARGISRHPVVTSLIVLALLGGAAAYGIEHAKIASGSVDDELPADDPVAQLQRRIEEDYGAFERAYLVVRGDLTDPQVLRAIHDATRTATNITGVRDAASVTDLLLADARTDEGAIDLARTGVLGAAGQAASDESDLPRTQTEARERLDRLYSDPLWRGLVPFTISADYRLGIVALTVEPWNSTAELDALADALTIAARDLQATLPREADAEAAGAPLNRASIAQNVVPNLARVAVGASVAVLVVLLIVWLPRRGHGLASAAVAAAVVLGTCALLLASVPALDWLHQDLHARDLAPANQARLSDMLLLAVAIGIASAVDNVVVLTHRYHEELALGRGSDEARDIAFRTGGRAITATTLVNAGAFAALAGAYFLQSKNLAILAAVAILAAYVLAILLAPLAMRGARAA